MWWNALFYKHLFNWIWHFTFLCIKCIALDYVINKMHLVFALFPTFFKAEKEIKYLKTFHLCDFVTYALEESNFFLCLNLVTERYISAAAHISVKE